MTQVSDYVQGPYQGVSQVAMQQRLMGSCAEMVNCVAYVNSGVQKRPPFELLGDLPLGEPLSSKAVFHRVQQGSYETDLYLVINWTGTSNKAYLFQASTRTPVALTVAAAAQTYMNAAGAQGAQGLKTSTIEDTTFITNTGRQVQTSGSTAAARPYEALIWIKSSEYGRTITATVDPSGGTPVSTSYSTSTGGTASDVAGIGTDRQAKGLYDGTNPGGSVTITGTPLNTLTSQGFTVTNLGSVIYIAHPTIDFTVFVKDDQGGAAITAIKEKVQRFSDLPSQAVDGFTVRVAQEAAGSNSDYYVQFEANSSLTQGTYKEVVKPGAPLGLDPNTMSVGLVYDAGWTIKVLPWGQRTTGDAELSPDPGFVTDYIQDVSWFRGRLALISKAAHLNLSASDDPFKFYTTTLATVLDSDKFGFLNPADRKAFFYAAASFDQRLVVFGDGVQSITEADRTVTATTTQNTTISMASFTDQVPTVSVYQKLYFATLKANGMSIQELSVDRVSGIIDPIDTSAQLTHYLPRTLNRATSKEKDFWALYSTAGSDELFQHCTRHDENRQRIQNSWWKWYLPSGFVLINAYVDGAYLYVAAGYGSLLKVLRMDTEVGITDTNSSILQYLDLKETLTSGTYSAGTDTTTFTLAQPVTSETIASVTLPLVTDGYPEAYPPEVTSRTSTTVTLKGDWTSYALLFGRVIYSYFTPNSWYVRDQEGNRLLDGKLTLKRLKADVAKLGYLRAEVVSPGRGTREYVYEGYQTDNEATPMDQPPQEETYAMKVDLGFAADKGRVTFVNDSHLGFKMLGYQWVGDWSPRSRGM